MNDKILSALSKHKMLSRGDEVFAGVSGGADSVSLLHFLCSIRQEWDIKLTAVHVNHNLRGAESKRDEDYVRSLCEKLGVRLITRSVDIRTIAADSGKSIEETARDERYRIFSSLAGENGKIATAHTLNDSAETQLINLARGTGIKGLAGIPPVRGNIIRPLIFCTRKDVEKYCGLHGLDYVTDSTNLTDDYARNRVRHHAVPALEAVNPAFLTSAGRAMELLREDITYLDKVSDEAFNEISRESALDIERLISLPYTISSRIIMRLFESENIPCGRDRVDRALALASSKNGSEQLTGKYILRAANSLLSLEEILEPVPYFECQIDVQNLNKSILIELTAGKTIKITPLSREDFEYNYKTDVNHLKNALDYDRIGKIIIFRQRLPADRIRLAGRGCTKTLKKLYNEAGIPPAARSSLAVIQGRDTALFWAEGFGVGEDVGVSADTMRILYLETIACTDNS